MSGLRPDRRDFLLGSGKLLGGGWLALQLPALAALAACARDAAERGEELTTLTLAEGIAMAAFADRIIPPDDLPGATQAGALHFIDRVLGGPFAGILPPIRAGLADLDVRASQLPGGSGGFSTLATERQSELMDAIEDTEFFALGRMLTVMSVFADPSYGGNRDAAGPRILGYEPHGAYQPPFGWYDGEGMASGSSA